MKDSQFHFTDQKESFQTRTFYKEKFAIFGPFESDQLYFVTRHPLPILTGIRPFSSLQDKFWLNYAMIYSIFVLLSLCAYFTWIKRLNFSNFFAILMEPADLVWYQPFPRGLLLRVAFSFTFWTFNVLYGVDLWSTLVSQQFEAKVESWR